MFTWPSSPIKLLSSLCLKVQTSNLQEVLGPRAGFVSLVTGNRKPTQKFCLQPQRQLSAGTTRKPCFPREARNESDVLPFMNKPAELLYYFSVDWNSESSVKPMWNPCQPYLENKVKFVFLKHCWGSKYWKDKEIEFLKQWDVSQRIFHHLLISSHVDMQIFLSDRESTS
jgi:hypothetical protein